jgi:lysophospholipase L1-like esterase
MQTILCFGDSNTWGYDPAATARSLFPIRYAPDVRWTGVLAKELGADFRVIEEGQNGRTTVHDDPIAPASRNGRQVLPVILESHKPLDLVVMMLGSNDLKTLFNLPPQDIALGASLLVKMILQSDASPAGKAPQVLLVCPPAIANLDHLPDIAARIVNGREHSLQLPKYYEAVAKLHGVHYLNSQEHTVPSQVDGVHLDAEIHTSLGKAVAAKVVSIFA